MSRYRRPAYDEARLKACLNEHCRQQNPASTADERNRRFFDDWCDGDAHAALLGTLVADGGCHSLPSRAQRYDDPAPPITKPPAQGFRTLWLISAPKAVEHALTTPAEYSNLPYAELGGGAFLLARDLDWEHTAQKAFVQALLRRQCAGAWSQVAEYAVRQSALLTLTEDEFDLAAWAGQAALRYMSIVFGFGYQDYPLLERSAQAAYRALQYIAIGRHFVSEPGTVPEAQRAVASLITRISALTEEYDQLDRAPRRFGPRARECTPFGAQPLHELQLSSLGPPLLRALPGVTGDLSGHDRAMVCAMLIAGTLGNIQTAACQVVDDLLASGNAAELRKWQAQNMAGLAPLVGAAVLANPPLRVLPRRVIAQVAIGNATISEGDDCLLLLQGSTRCPHAAQHVWGDATPPGAAAHSCLGKDLALPLITALVRHAIGLPGLARAIDPLTGDTYRMARLWGVACTSLPLSYKRVRSRAQRNLIVSMRIKSPIAEHAAELRHLIAAAVPRIEHVLSGFSGVHFAWFEFSDDETHLILRTIYNGELDPYLHYFAEQAGDLFDGLFEHIEEAPPRPVSAFPEAFIATVRRFNRAPLAGYLYSAYPDRDVPMCRR